jgi:hypothetical protein
MLLLKALYTPVTGTDPEYAQGAIERNDLAHREVVHFAWLIEVPEPGDAAQWRARLNETVDAAHGSFDVVPASEDERRKVECGEITLQR